MQETVIFYPKNVKEWRKWLEQHHATKQSVWLVFYNRKSAKSSITWSEAVDVALCFGWIDSKKISIDDERSHQFFSRRKEKSTWSKINKDKVEKLIDAGLMSEAGFRSIEIAKQNGSWTILDEVEELIVPEDLQKAFGQHTGSRDYFEGLSKSVKKMLLQWLVLAKRPETRQKRIDEIATLAAKGERPKPF